MLRGIRQGIQSSLSQDPNLLKLLLALQNDPKIIALMRDQKMRAALDKVQ